MAVEIELDLRRLRRLIEKSPDAAARGAKRGLHDALDDWVRESRDIAPKDTHTLQKSITAQDIEGTGLNLDAPVSANAITESRRGKFNYAYYIHEDEGKAVTGEKKFLDKPAQENYEKWMSWIEEEIQKELEREGW